MDFGLYPPEVNSARMYAGPGAGPMLAAATAWAGLAADLELTANGWQSILGELGIAWTGPSATAMTAAATPYVAWMHRAAEQAERTATQAHAAVTAFEAAFAMTVPPPVVAANRSQLLALIATNFFGQNTPAIAATEAAYAAMWAQDATAMYGYAGAAAGATALPPFTPPPQVTDPAGAVEETAQAGRAVATSTATTVQQTLTKLSSALQGTSAPAAVKAVGPAAPVAATPPAGGLPTNGLIHLGLIPAHIGLDLFGAVIIDGLGVFAIDLPGAAGSMMLKDIAAVGAIPSILAGVSSPGAVPVAAGLGQAIPLSGLSVPSTWTTAAGAERPVPGLPAAKPPVLARADMTASPPHSLSPGLAGMAGLRAMSGVDGDQQRGSASSAKAGRGRVKAPRAQEIDIATELRELMDLHCCGILTDTEFAKEKERLFAE